MKVDLMRVKVVQSLIVNLSKKWAITVSVMLKCLTFLAKQRLKWPTCKAQLQITFCTTYRSKVNFHQTKLGNHSFIHCGS